MGCQYVSGSYRNKFASGRHSRIYRGIYKDRDVVIKLISQPEEDGDLAAFLEKQFTSEVAMMFRLNHPNIITESGTEKPIVAFIAGLTAPPGRADLFPGTTRNHSIRGKGTAQDKIKTLREAGVTVVESPAKIGTAMLDVFKQ